MSCSRGFLFAMVCATPVAAVELNYTLLTHPDFAGRSSGLDGFWDTADDLTLPGLNTFMAASTFRDSFGNFGFSKGENVSDTNGIDAYSYTSYSFEPQVNAFDLSYTNLPGTGALFTATGPHGGTFNSVTQTFVQDLDTIFSYGFGDAGAHAHGEGTYLFNGQDPAHFISNPGLLAHANYVIARLPSNWRFVLFTTESFEIFDVNTLLNIGLTGVGSQIAFSVVPLPAAFPLFGCALLALSGLRKVGRRNRVG